MKKLIIFFTVFTAIACQPIIDPTQSGDLVPKTVTEDPNLPSLFINGTYLHLEAFGNPDDPILIFLHGGPGGDYRNARQLSELADDGYRVILFDQRSTGLSERHDFENLNIEVLIEDLHQIITHFKQNEEQKVILLGHSWGGIYACGFINKYPEIIDGVIFGESAGFTSEILKAYGEDTRSPSFFSETLSNITYLDQFLNGSKTDHAVLDYKIGVYAAEQFSVESPEGVIAASPVWRFGGVVLNALTAYAMKDGYDFTTELSKFTGKVLFLYSENNLAYGLKGVTQDASFFPQAELLEIKNTGHEFIYFEWPQVKKGVLQFLNSIKS